MKENKMALKRALNEYKGKKDYERLLEKYIRLEDMYTSVSRSFHEYSSRYIESDNLVRRLKSAVIVLFNLLLAALVACGYLWCKLQAS